MLGFNPVPGHSSVLTVATHVRSNLQRVVPAHSTRNLQAAAQTAVCRNPLFRNRIPLETLNYSFCLLELSVIV